MDLQSMDEIAPNLYSHESSGSWNDIGESLGIAAGPLLEERVKHSESRFEEIGDQAHAALRRVADIFRANFPYLDQELEGLATGSGISLQSLKAHLFLPGILQIVSTDDGCTDIIIPNGIDGPLLYKTHDATAFNPQPVIVRSIKPHDHYGILCVTRLDGFSGMTGLNEKGLAVGEASLLFHTMNPAGTVRNLLVRPLLHECSNVAEAVDYLAQYPPLNFGFHFALVDKSGSSAIVERSPVEQHVRWSAGENIFCTNHAVTPAVREKERSRGPDGDRNSDQRYGYLLDELSGVTSMTIKELQALVISHPPKGSICQHGDPAYTSEQQPFYPLFTQRAFINVVQEGKLMVANGQPCNEKFIEFRL